MGPDSETSGNQPILLIGQVNFTEWLRELKLVALVKGVWTLFSGEEVIIQPPARPVMPDPTIFKVTTKLTGSEAKMAQMASEVAINEHKLDVAEHTLLLTVYRKQEKRVCEALELLLNTIHPTILGSIDFTHNPKDNLLALENAYKTTGARALHNALDKLERLTLNKCSSMSDYINKTEAFRQDVNDLLGGESQYGDHQLSAKLIADFRTSIGVLSIIIT
jgi:hypothetical protein